MKAAGHTACRICSTETRVLNKNKGFTLVELVTTIILIGILAVTVAPRLIKVTGFSAYSVRNQIISELRAVQQSALNNSDLCYRVSFDHNGYVAQRAARTATDCDGFSDIPGTGLTWDDGVTVTSRNAEDFNVNFDALGGIKLSNRCVGNCITVAADDRVQIELTTAGYISAQ